VDSICPALYRNAVRWITCCECLSGVWVDISFRYPFARLRHFWILRKHRAPSYIWSSKSDRCISCVDSCLSPSGSHAQAANVPGQRCYESVCFAVSVLPLPLNVIGLFRCQICKRHVWLPLATVKTSRVNQKLQNVQGHRLCLGFSSARILPI